MNDTTLELLTITEVARQISDISCQGLRNILKRHGIRGDAILVEAKVRSELFLKPRVQQFKQLVEGKS